MPELKLTNQDLYDANLALKLLGMPMALFRERLLAAGFVLDPTRRIAVRPSLDLKGYVLTQAEEQKPAEGPVQ